jgi:hypothetical protein
LADGKQLTNIAFIKPIGTTQQCHYFFQVTSKDEKDLHAHGKTVDTTTFQNSHHQEPNAPDNAFQ